MNSDNDNSIFFLTISLVCVWLIVDYVVGKQYVGKFISMLPFMGGDNTAVEAGKNGITVSQQERLPEITAKIEQNIKEGKDKYDGLTLEEIHIYEVSNGLRPNPTDIIVIA